MTAWAILIANSTVSDNSIAWLHLNSQAGGGGTVQVFSELEVQLMSDLDVELESDLETVIESEQYSVELEPELQVEVC